jgi:hypothetical protein
LAETGSFSLLSSFLHGDLSTDLSTNPVDASHLSNLIAVQHYPETKHGLLGDLSKEFTEEIEIGKKNREKAKVQRSSLLHLNREGLSTLRRSSLGSKPKRKNQIRRLPRLRISAARRS